ncbi:MAG: PAS domain S-box protein [Desulfobacteraceae bacterium]
MNVQEMDRLLQETRAELCECRERLESEKGISESIIASLPGFYFMVDEAGRYIRWNRNLETMLGYSHEELLGRDSLDLVPPEDKEKIRASTERGFRDGFFHVEYHNIRKDGLKIPYFAQGVSMEINGQRYLIGVEIDLTRLRDTERALRESEEHLRSLMETADNFAVYRIAFREGDPKHADVVFVSPSIKELMGIEDPDTLDNWFENIHPEDKARILNAHFSLPRKTRVDESMRVFNPRHGEWRWIQFISTSVMDRKGLLQYSNGIIFDITDRVEVTEMLRQKEEELKKQTHKLAQLNTALQVLVEQREQEISDIERGFLNTFDRLIKPYLSDLSGTPLTDEQRTYIEIIQANLNKILSPLSKRLSDWRQCLTPTEIKVVDLIRHGKRTKEIAELLHISNNAVSFHRKRIRRKLGLTGEKINLVAYLHSLEEK